MTDREGRSPEDGDTKVVGRIEPARVALDAPPVTDRTPPDPGLLCLAMIARLHGINADPHQLRHQLGRSVGKVGVTELLKAAKLIDLKAKTARTRRDRLDDTPLPAIAQDQEGGFFILAKVGDGEVLIHDPVEGRPLKLSDAELETRWNGNIVLFTKRAGLAGDERKFDFTWFIPAVVKYRKLFGEVLLASFFVQCFALVTPLFFQVVIDKVMVHRGLTSLHVLVIGLAAIAIFEVMLTGLRTYVFSHTTNRIDVELGAKLYRHVMGLPLAYFGARRVGETVARIRELDSIRNFLTGSALTLVIDLLFVFVFFAVMYVYSPMLTYVVLGSIPFYVLVAWLVSPTLRARLQDKFQRGAENQSFLVESVTGVETVKAMGVEPQMQRKWEEQLAGYVHSAFRASNLNNIAGQFVQLINKIVIALVLWFGAQAVIAGDLSIGQLIAFNMLSGRVSGPILRLSQLWQEFQQARISIARLGDILNTKTETAVTAGRTTMPKVEGRITFDNVTFRYRPDTAEVLRRVNLDIPKGQIVGIVGPSGSGKSTLTKLVQRLYVPESGRVMVDGVDLAMLDPAWLRRRIGVVLQENYLFNKSVRDNIALSDPGMDMERVVAAAKLAGAHDFILEMPEAYDTIVGERGGTLSGGQRQRVAIARALVTDPRILIFDEATSALDYESERIIQDNMRKICDGRTVLIIAHRLSTVRHADRIITVEAGEVVEDGTHDELIRAKGRYAMLHSMQSQ